MENDRANFDLPTWLTKADLAQELQRESLEIINSKYDSFVKIYTNGSVVVSTGYFNQDTGEYFHSPANGVVWMQNFWL